MRLDDYFDVFNKNDIRVKGTRVGIETILYDFIHRSQSPETITRSYPSLTLEQVYATITYYLHNKEAVSTYLTEWIEHGKRMREQQAKNPTPVMRRLQRSIFILNPDMMIGETAQKLAVIWGASEPEEYRNLIHFLPVSS